jgi:hypothetical protein
MNNASSHLNRVWLLVFIVATGICVPLLPADAKLDAVAIGGYFGFVAMLLVSARLHRAWRKAVFVWLLGTVAFAALGVVLYLWG